MNFYTFIGASIETSDKKSSNSLLHTAVQSPGQGRLEVVRILLRRGCDPNVQRTGNRDAPAHIAAKLGFLDVLQVS